MFFPRLRRRAKWVFLALALVFALGFVGFGVGAGGSGIGDYLSDLFNRKPGSSAPSLEDAQKKVDANPNDAAARLKLATALQTAGRIDEAITQLERYTKLRPKDADGLQQLGALYERKAAEARDRLAVAQAEAAGVGFSQDIANSGSPLSDALVQDPITKAEQERLTTEQNAVIEEIQGAYGRATDVYSRLSKVTPDEPTVYLQLGQAAYFSGDTAGAIDAYETFLKLAPDDPNAPLVKRQLKLLKSGFSGSGDTG